MRTPVITKERKIYTAHNPPKVTGSITVGESMTKQSFKDETDINQIVKRYHQTGLLPKRSGTPAYQDFTNADDFTNAQFKIKQAEQSFEALPIPLKKRFSNKPEKLMDFLADAKNHDEAIDLGLIFGEKNPLPPETTLNPKEPEKGSKEPLKGDKPASTT